MNTIRKYGQLCLLFFLHIHAVSQPVYDGKISVDARLKKDADSLYLVMTIGVDRLEIDRNHSLVLTPVLADEQNEAEYPPVLLNGKNRHKSYMRSVALDKTEKEMYTEIRTGKHSGDILYYRHAVRYEPWMDTARISLREDMCKCPGRSQQVAIEFIVRNMSIDDFTPAVAYIQPVMEDIKQRDESMEIMLDFHINNTEILPNYRNNRVELERIEKALEILGGDENLQVNEIEITGYASPEGEPGFNQRLSEARADALKKHLFSKIRFPLSVYRVKFGGEDWDGLVNLLNQSDMEEKEQILSIIHTTDDPEIRKEKIKQLDDGVPFQKMLVSVLPDLRRVICHFRYQVRHFDIEECRKVIKTSPRQLSLDEMYRISDSYPKGSMEFADVFSIAVRVYPEDPVANLNASAIALLARDIVRAENYLKKSTPDTPEYLNNLGVFHLLKGDMEQAKKYLTGASENGSEEAEYNLKVLAANVLLSFN